MNMKAIRAKAQDLKVKNYSRLRKDELIWAIQLAEGHTDCFLKIQGCGQMDCLWRPECQG